MHAHPDARNGSHHAEALSDSEQATGEGAGAGSGVDVLVVDDDDAVRRLVRATLRDGGLSVVTAADGQEALEAVAGWRPRVVIVDLEMPVMNGRELIAALRERGADTAFVILSAHGARRAGRELAIDTAVEKPFDPQDLLDQVKRASPR